MKIHQFLALLLVLGSTACDRGTDTSRHSESVFLDAAESARQERGAISLERAPPMQ